MTQPTPSEVPEESPDPMHDPDAASAESASEESSMDAKLRQLEQERDEWKDRTLRTAAELDNFRKRARRDIDEARQKGLADLAARIVEVLDNLDRAWEAIPAEEKDSQVAKGVEMVRHQMIETLRNFGIERLDPLGQPFDPYAHEAIMEEPRADVPPGTVLEVLTKGYRLQD